MMELGAIGSPIDVATFIAVVVLFRYEVARDVETMAAGLVALARGDRGVDHELLASELEVDDRDVDRMRPTVVDGGRDG